MTSARLPFYRSLRLKLVLVSVVVEVIMLGLLLANSLRLMNTAVESQMRTVVYEITPLVDAAIAARLFERDHAAIIEILNKVIRDQEGGMRYVAVYDDTGTPYAKVGVFDPAQPPSLDMNVEDAVQDGVFDTESPLTLSNEVIGRIRLGFSLRSFLDTKSALFRQGLLIAATEVMLTLLLLSLAGYLLTRHIGRLVEATRGIRKGNYDTQILTRTNDEIGLLAENFNLMTAAIRDRIEQLRRSEHDLFEAKERALVTLHSIGDGVITTDVSGRIEYLNPVAEELTGWTNFEATGRDLSQVFQVRNEATHAPIASPIEKCLRENAVVTLSNHTLLVRRDGTEFPIEDSAAPIRDRGGAIIGAVLVFHDVSSARQMARQMAYQARHDSLTGLVNRREFERRLERAINSAASENRVHGLCYLDLDQFKIVNDTCGHFAGDELLRQLAVLLKTKVRDADTLARLGGDEFGVLLENCPFQRAVDVASELRDLVRGFQFTWESRTFEIGVSIGVVAIDADSSNIGTVLSAADVACYIAKDAGRNRIHAHEVGDQEHARRHGEMQWATRIATAIADESLQLYVQRIEALSQDARIGHVELLLRMVESDGQIVPPAVFIPAAERFYLMQQLDRWVVRTALKRIAELGEGVWQNTLFGINISGQSIADAVFRDYVLEQVRDSRVAPKSLCFEITETTAIANLTDAVQFISDVRRLGCRFALDDFGSGLSSFAYLKNLAVDYLKIDGAFVKDMTRSETDQAMVEAINHIGHVMGIQTVAEYVETPEILEAVRAAGVDYAQGYAIHRPELFTAQAISR